MAHTVTITSTTASACGCCSGGSPGTPDRLLIPLDYFLVSGVCASPYANLNIAHSSLNILQTTNCLSWNYQLGASDPTETANMRTENVSNTVVLNSTFRIPNVNFSPGNQQNPQGATMIAVRLPAGAVVSVNYDVYNNGNVDVEDYSAQEALGLVVNENCRAASNHATPYFNSVSWSSFNTTSHQWRETGSWLFSVNSPGLYQLQFTSFGQGLVYDNPGSAQVPSAITANVVISANVAINAAPAAILYMNGNTLVEVDCANF